MLNIDFENELTKRKILDNEQLLRAKTEAKNYNGRLSSAIVALGFCTSAEIAIHIAEIYQVKTANIKKMPIDRELKNEVSKTFCEQFSLVPILKTPDELVLAISDPSVFYAKHQIEQLITQRISLIITTEENIRNTMDFLFGNTSADVITMPSAVEVPMRAASGGTPPVAVTTVNSQPPKKSAPIIAPAVPKQAAPLMTLKGDVTQMVNSIISEAIKKKSSDIHIEQFEKKYRVRFRIDGLMQEAFLPVTGSATELVSRIKVMSKLDVSEKRRPQDGRTKFQVGSDKFVDLRVNILPTLFGEKVVMRVLDKGNLELGMTSLGFSPQQLEQVERALEKPQGMILVTGPTGSGKTTTLYSALHSLNDISCNISTCEDPVEFYIDGINQVQVNSDIGFNFADALRAFLRQDPDVIMVGEIRDTETANVAYKASSTGHLVLSTLHTNDAVSTIYRLIDMDVPKYIVAEGTSIIIAQRLLKKNCPQCITTESIAPHALKELGVLQQDLPHFATTKVSSGCGECNHTGLKGRVAIHEVLELNSQLKKSISASIPAQEFRNLAVKSGMTTLRGRALELMRDGVICYSEVSSGTMSDDNE